MEELFEIFPPIVIGIAVLYTIVVSAVKAQKNKAKQGAKKPIADTSAKVDAPEKTPDEQFDEIHKKMENSREASNDARLQRKKERQLAQKDKYRYDSRNTVGSVDDTSLDGDGKVVEKAKEVKMPERELHVHPAQKTADGKTVKKEKVPVHKGSLGGESTEGCGEHADVRYVLEEVKTNADDVDATTAELQRLIVWGEILSSPKFKGR